MKNYKFFTIMLFILVLIISTFSVFIRETHSVQKQSLSGQEYVDPKGFFTIYPPLEWKVREYPKDPRGKVAFIHPDIKNTDLRVIAQAESYTNFEELVKNTEMRAKQIRTKFNGRVEIQRTSLGNAPALRVMVTIPNQLKQLQFLFLRGKIYYNIAFGTLPNMYDDFFTVAINSIETFEPSSRDVTHKDVIRHSVAAKVRRATLLIEMGQLEDALEAVNEGLKISPGNSKLRDLKTMIEKIGM